jgi:radical SAM/Cys-rich protein
MNPEEQLGILNKWGGETHFTGKLKESSQFPLKPGKIEILQMNIGRICNLRCKHCHVEAGPDRKEVMPRPIFEKCLETLKNSSIATVDITGGAPEMNPHLEWFIKEVSRLKRRLLVRSNFVILLEPGYRKFIDIYADNGVEVIGSLPHYLPEKTDQQRGSGVFANFIQVMKALNKKGYGQEGQNLILSLVHNPVGAFLPGAQADLEYEYKQRLLRQYGVVFTNLYTITNMPIGRYLEYLLKSENFYDYMEVLANAYNPCAVEKVMCRSTVSVSWEGILYDCDFNQVLGLPVNHGTPDHIDGFDPDLLASREIVISNHCFGCTAGTGSSCQGATIS